MDVLTIVAVISVTGWSVIYALILLLTSQFVIRARLKVLTALLAAFFGMLVPALLVVATQMLGIPIFEAIFSPWRLAIQFATILVIIVCGSLTNALLLRREDGSRINLYEGFKLQVTLTILAMGFRFLLWRLGVLAGFSWF